MGKRSSHARPPWSRSRLLAALLGLAALSLALWLPNLFFAIPPPDLNTEYVAWIDGRLGHCFQDSGTPGEVCTDPRLVRLDNERTCFSKIKDPDTLRIFCIGGSTTRGWPFHHGRAYPELLGLRLKELDGRKTEVINAGFLASDSLLDLRLVKELAAYSPDIFLLYEGRNEAMNYPARRTLQRMLRFSHLWLDRNLYVYGAARRLLSGAGPGVSKTTLLGLTAIARVGAGRERRREEFVSNILAIKAAAEESGARAVFIAQPFYPPDKTVKPDLEGLTGGRRLLHGIFADRQRELASRLESETEAANGWLKETAEKDGLELLRLDEIFRREGAESLLIEPLLTHPNREGYCLMARSVAAYLSPESAGGTKTCALSREETRAAYECAGELFGSLGYGRYRDLYLERAGRLSSP